MRNETIKEIVYQLGADICGIANVDKFRNAPKGFHPQDIFSGSKSVIVFAKQFPKGTFLSQSYAPYTMARNQLIQEIDILALNLSLIIEKNGFLAVPIPSSEPYEYWDSKEKHGRGILSLKHSAQLAGVGIIGKNTLLVNEKYGNRLWLGGVITNADLESDLPAKKICPQKCTICIDSCPQKALNGITIDQKKCREICFTSTEGGGWMITCNLCRTKCPFAKI
ncbi:MAG: putative Fe-S protein-like protein [Bacteroidetes bacterium]|nr:putative Fe-S protein-like protein [Bacteroidota bacterium]